jgi:acyl-homoserine lactone acylase PvdQ
MGASSLRISVICALAVLATALAIAPASAQGAASVQPYQQDERGGYCEWGNLDDFSCFRSILPPGENGFASGDYIAQFQLAQQCRAQSPDPSQCPAYPPVATHSQDQLAMYTDLVYNTPGFLPDRVQDFFKDASFGSRYGPEPCGNRPVCSTGVYMPPARCPLGLINGCDVVIYRDTAFGIPHVYGETRAAVEYGAGYVAAEDRLFFMDVLRHVGRGQGSGFAGGSLKQNDTDQWAFAPYREDDPQTPANEDEYQQQYDLADEVYGDEGVQLQQDVTNYVAGINGYITEARLNPNLMPGEYALVGQTLQDWKVSDPIATASLIGGLLGKGGGNEVGSAKVLEEAQKRFGKGVGRGVWGDFRRAEDPEAPTTVHGTSFPYEVPRGIDSRAVAMPDQGSIVDAGPTSGSSSAPAALSLPSAMSNALLVSAAHSDYGVPIAVMGPQVAYWMPEVLMEEDLHCIGNCGGGPDIDAEGATFPGVSLYVLLGHGPDFAWSATSAGQDIIDTFAEQLCETDGSEPTINSTHYMYRDQCLPMETLTRSQTVLPNPGDDCNQGATCGPFTLTSLRTVHGIVYKRGTVKNRPVAFVRARTSYFHEADSSRAFMALNSGTGPHCETAPANTPCQVSSARDFQHAMYKMNLTFNWFYADNRDIAYFNSGNNPVRARGVDPNFPTTGGGRWDWQRFDPILRDANGNRISGFNTAAYTSFSEHPQVINQPYITSWNNKQAPGYRAADDNFAFGSVYRSEPLDEGIEAALALDDGRPGSMNLADLISVMEEAGTVDLRAREILPYMLDIVGNPGGALGDAVTTLRNWYASGSTTGAQRRDINRDNVYENAAAIQLMDAWWPRAVKAIFNNDSSRPWALGDDLFNAILDMPHVGGHGIDNAPNNGGEHLGSAYQDGWYGYVDKDLRTLLQREGLLTGPPIEDTFSRIYCGNGNLNGSTGCRQALRDSLQAALSDTPADLYGSDPTCTANASLQWCYDSVRYRPVGGISVPPQHWINRPTFQQAVQVSDHR